MRDEFFRPGVYTSYQLQGGGTVQRSPRLAGVVAAVQESTPGGAYRFTSLEEAQAAVDGPALALVQQLLAAGCGPVCCAPVAPAATAEGYRQGFERLRAYPEVYALICDSAALPVLQTLGQEALAQRRIGFAGIADPQAALAAAQALNSERVALCCDEAGAAAGAALAAAVLQGEPGGSLAGRPLPGLTPGETPLPEETLAQLCRGGVTACEPVGEELRILRAVTTRTRTGGLTDRGFASLATVQTVDVVLQGVQTALRARVEGGGATLEEIQTQTVVELGALLEEGLLAGFETPAVQAWEENPAVCLVELRFTPASAIDTICLTAKIAV